MSSDEFPIFVSYSQVTVFDHSLERPFNQWTDRHVVQGFSWRQGSVAFRTLAESGQHLVTVTVDVIEEELSPEAIRVIDVPFEVPADGAIEIGSISDSSLLEIPPGMYTLRFECCAPVSSEAGRICLRFVRKTGSTFRIVRADPELHAEEEVLLTTSAA